MTLLEYHESFMTPEQYYSLLLNRIKALRDSAQVADIDQARMSWDINFSDAKMAVLGFLEKNQPMFAVQLENFLAEFPELEEVQQSGEID